MSFSSRFSLLNSFNSTPNSNKSPASSKRTSSAKRKLNLSKKSNVKLEKKRIEFDSDLDDFINPDIEENSVDEENFTPHAGLQLNKTTKQNLLNDSKMSFKSPDKSEILQFLSCDPNEFNHQNMKKTKRQQNDVLSNIEIDEQFSCSQDFEEITKSQNIDDCNISSLESLINTHTQDSRISNINQTINEFNETKVKPVYARNLIKNGLAEKLRSVLKHQKLKSTKEVTSNDDTFALDKRRIQVQRFAQIYGRLLIKFIFIDDILADDDTDEMNYMFLNEQFLKIINVGVSYEIIFDYRQIEIFDKKKVYFSNRIKATK
ncbi:unnamed protein product [Diamesa serratosioi]